ncbi:MAG: CBS domain-containing protein [Candidatus Azotimanducaceae bacterium]|jgi:CBS domain-containing protein
MLYSVELSDYMLNHPITLTKDTTIAEAADLITESKVSGVLVVNDHREVIGILSELDCLRVVVDGFKGGASPASVIVGDVMTTQVEAQDPHDDIVDVAASMLDHKHRRRPVVKDGKLIGQVTCRQILRVFGLNAFKAAKAAKK